MYVCVCMAVTDAEVEDAITSGAHSREAVTKACRAGGDCGACHGMIEGMIEDHLESRTCPGLVAAEALVRGRAA